MDPIENKVWCQEHFSHSDIFFETPCSKLVHSACWFLFCTILLSTSRHTMVSFFPAAKPWSTPCLFPSCCYFLTRSNGSEDNMSPWVCMLHVLVIINSILTNYGLSLIVNYKNSDEPTYTCFLMVRYCVRQIIQRRDTH